MGNILVLIQNQIREYFGNHFLPTFLEFSYLKIAKALFLTTGYDVLNLVKKSLRYTNKTLRCLSK